jgi:lipid-A-disaccharide synthase-like uncharacterized protein
VLVIDHHTNYMWVRFLKSKDDTRSELESFFWKFAIRMGGTILRPVPSRMF